MENKFKKIVLGVLVTSTFTCILLLTFQSPEATTKLSEAVRLWLEQLGILRESHTIRSQAHIIMYFLFGIILTCFGFEKNWRGNVIALLGASAGLLDECLKIALPTREFDFGDWLRDCLGVALAWLLLSAIRFLRRKD